MCLCTSQSLRMKEGGRLSCKAVLCIPNIPPTPNYPPSLLFPPLLLFDFTPTLHTVHLIPASKLRVEFDGLCAVCEDLGGSLSSNVPLPLSLLLCYYYYCICRMMHMCQMRVYPVTQTKLSIIGLGFNSSERGKRE